MQSAARGGTSSASRTPWGPGRGRARRPGPPDRLLLLLVVVVVVAVVVVVVVAVVVVVVLVLVLNQLGEKPCRRGSSSVLRGVALVKLLITFVRWIHLSI